MEFQRILILLAVLSLVQGTLILEIEEPHSQKLRLLQKKSRHTSKSSLIPDRTDPFSADRIRWIFEMALAMFSDLCHEFRKSFSLSHHYTVIKYSENGLMWHMMTISFNRQTFQSKF